MVGEGIQMMLKDLLSRYFVIAVFLSIAIIADLIKQIINRKKHKEDIKTILKLSLFKYIVVLLIGAIIYILKVIFLRGLTSVIDNLHLK